MARRLIISVAGLRNGLRYLVTRVREEEPRMAPPCDRLAGQIFLEAANVPLPQVSRVAFKSGERRQNIWWLQPGPK
jgi:hypothetical protein